ncbi:alginate lyase family protein [uncultured Winogradskyella sp.]|uniref:alginate lyase family protein n=1 Tax=uncultured Winogradskyella sp. TaxID=395353 RepID=UPI003515C8DA
MSLKEVLFFRVPQQLQLKIFGRIHRFKKFKPTQIEINANFHNNAYTKVKIFEEFVNSQSVQFNFFDCKIDLSDEINWLRDYRHNIQSTQSYYATIDKQNFEQVGDIKYVFEPSRFYFLPFLGLKAIANQDKHIKLLEKILRSWGEQNPYLRTVHWTSGIETGIRSVNLVYTHMVLKSSGIITEYLDHMIKELVQYHYHFLARHLSLYSSANNHLVAELTGLVAVSSYFDNKTYKKQRQVWQKRLLNEIIRQVNDDGVNMELCTHYHAEVTDHFFNALQFIVKSGQKVPEIIEKRFLKMFDFLDHVEYKGNKTIFGDNDEGALIHPCFDNGFSIYQSLLQSAAYYYKLKACSKLNTQVDLRNYLIFGDPVLSYNPNKTSCNYKDIIFKSSGYAFFYDHDRNAKVSFDFGNIGDNISAAHGHSDIFHFNFEINGEPILVDSGTYQYHKRHKEWRAYFRGVTAHNTISINKKDHALQATRMSWLERPKTTLKDFKIDKNYSLIEGLTSAYKRENIDYTRKLILDKKRKILSIEDDLLLLNNKKRSFSVEFYLNFGDNVKLINEGAKLMVKTTSFQIVIENLIFNQGKILKANDKSTFGWRSKEYNRKHPGQTFLVKFDSTQSQRLRTNLYY